MGRGAASGSHVSAGHKGIWGSPVEPQPGAWRRGEPAVRGHPPPHPPCTADEGGGGIKLSPPVPERSPGTEPSPCRCQGTAAPSGTGRAGCCRGNAPPAPPSPLEFFHLAVPTGGGRGTVLAKTVFMATAKFPPCESKLCRVGVTGVGLRGAVNHGPPFPSLPSLPLPFPLLPPFLARHLQGQQLWQDTAGTEPPSPAPLFLPHPPPASSSRGSWSRGAGGGGQRRRGGLGANPPGLGGRGGPCLGVRTPTGGEGGLPQLGAPRREKSVKITALIGTGWDGTPPGRTRGHSPGRCQHFGDTLVSGGGVVVLQFRSSFSG